MTQQQKKTSGYIPKPSAKKKAKVDALQAVIDERNKEPTLEELTACIAAAFTPIKTSSPPVAPNHPHAEAAVQLQGNLKQKHESQQEPKDS